MLIGSVSSLSLPSILKFIELNTAGVKKDNNLNKGVGGCGAATRISGPQAQDTTLPNCNIRTMRLQVLQHMFLSGSQGKS